jgi:hypothetical protein
MRQKAVISGLLLIAIGVVLGATVFRTDIAQATGLAQSVTVNNTPAQAVPVREQNLDGGNIKVREQGTVAVRSANEEVAFTTHVEGTGQCEIDLYTVPAGKQFILEWVGALTGAVGLLRADAEIRSDKSRLFLDFNRQSDNTAIASNDVHFAFPAGAVLHLIGSDAGGSCSFTVSVGGYLQPSSY